MFTKHEIRHFHLVVVHRRQRECTKKRDARAKFANLNLLLFSAVLITVVVV